MTPVVAHSAGIVARVHTTSGIAVALVVPLNG